jgi:trans-2,3-dihydro-3-hydroxyanthranilate isomerase
MQINFVTVDVFTEHQFGGNPLAVVLDAEGLDQATMQAIAAEFNLAETTFVLPPKDVSNTAEVRIFTPKSEMPFAGHPNIGTAYVLAKAGTSYGRNLSEPFVFEEKAGFVRLDLMRKEGLLTGATLATPQSLETGQTVPVGLVADACSISINDIEMRNHAPLVASCGALFVFAELKTRPALLSASPRSEIFSLHLPMNMATGIYLYWQGTGNPFDVECRMFAPLFGIPEDPATGSANAAMIGLLAQLRPEKDIEIRKTISQGAQINRPSVLEAVARKVSGSDTLLRIGGHCVPVSEGRITLADKSAD